MEWMLSVSDHIVELVPSWQQYPNGSTMEVRNFFGQDHLILFKASNLNGTHLPILQDYGSRCALRFGVQQNIISRQLIICSLV